MNYTAISAEFRQKFFELVDQAQRIVITGHKMPDDDSISSVLAVYEVIKLKSPDKDVRIMYTGDSEERYKSFRNFDKIEFVPDMADVVASDNLLIVLDGSQLYRFTEQPEKLQQVQTTICIDHHSSPIDNFTLSLVAPQYPANAELVYRALCKDTKISKELAETFLLGILGDTGNFSYLKPTQTETLLASKELLDFSGSDIQEFQSRYTKILPRHFEVFQELTKNTVFGVAPGWPNFQYTYVSEEFVQLGKYTESEISAGSAMYKDVSVRKIEGYSWGFVIEPTQKEDTSISTRSLPGSVNVRDMMERMKVGGGHDRAAGGTVKGKNVQQTIDLILDWLNKNKPLLG